MLAGLEVPHCHITWSDPGVHDLDFGNSGPQPGSRGDGRAAHTIRRELESWATPR